MNLLKGNRFWGISIRWIGKDFLFFKIWFINMGFMFIIRNYDQYVNIEPSFWFWKKLGKKDEL